MGIVAQERFRNNSRKTEEDRENDTHKINQGFNGGNDFQHREVYMILARETRWANLRDDGLNHAVNIPRNIARRTSDNSSPRNLVGSNNLSKDPDSPPTPQSVALNSNLDDSFYEGRRRPINQKLYKKNLAVHKKQLMVLLHLVAVSKQCWMNYSWRRDKGKKKRNEEEQKQFNTGKPKWISCKQMKIAKSWRKT
ncbi:hypothetical protein GIB67_009359 [Kingdonia uniflora]|uniref:Uncharacterized protein n=1 Tax=Kingdonia uniflora TaxID=39325 RepID=A0A7J7N381_9MAGN|nr:hypothetical protein GIB67_009359 [Kingdonia uniflora]